MPTFRRLFMHLAYIDDSGAHANCPIALYGALVIPDRLMLAIEGLSAMTAANLLPADRRGRVKEFHAYDLLKGEGIFEGINETARFKAIHLLLAYAQMHAPVFVYSAVDRTAF